MKSQIACVIASCYGMNSASIIDKARIVCLVLLQYITPLTKRKNVS